MPNNDLATTLANQAAEIERLKEQLSTTAATVHLLTQYVLRELKVNDRNDDTWNAKMLLVSRLGEIDKFIPPLRVSDRGNMPPRKVAEEKV